MSGWVAGNTASNPSPSSSTNGTGNVTYKYKVSTAADSTYTTTKPSAAGTYTVQATFATTTNYNAVTATANFTISAAYCKIGSTYYASYANAYSAASNNNTITFLLDQNIGSTTVSKTLTFDFNNKTVSGSISSSSTSLTLYNGTFSGTLSVTSGTTNLSAPFTITSSAAGNTIAVYGYGKLNANGTNTYRVYIKNTASASTSGVARCIYQYGSSTVSLYRTELHVTGKSATERTCVRRDAGTTTLNTCWVYIDGSPYSGYSWHTWGTITKTNCAYYAASAQVSPGNHNS